MKLVSRIFSYALSVVLIGVLIAGVWFRQPIMDWYRLKDYTPAPEIAALADNTTMSEEGRKLFFVNDPALLDKEAFNEKCTVHEDTIVLGCYITTESIYIYDVTDERLSGIKEVTAAHEMLHAAYDRLDEQERKEVDAMTVSFYDKINKDRPRLRSLVQNYAQQGPDVVNNELHSILGTEVRDLPAELENYYSRYFNNRHEVVGFAEGYEQVFVAQKEKIEQLKGSIDALSDDINSRRTSIQEDERELQAETKRLNDLRARDNVETYNAAVPGFNQKVEAYRSKVNAYNADIERLNKLIVEYNEQAVQQRELYNAIDSRTEKL